MARRKQQPSSPSPSPLRHFALCISVLFFIALSRPSSALHTVPGSPCDSVCASDLIGTVEQDTVCLDDDYLTSTIGKDYRKCVACGLNSTAVDTAGNVTDVEYALFDLRFTLSVCMFAFPIERVSISSPCQVTCQPLSVAIGYQLSNDSVNTSPNLDFCTAGQFDDTTINNCAACYGLIPQQLFMANFLQALHVACRQPPIAGQQFFPDAVSIFNESVIAGPGPPSTHSSNSSGFHGWKLALVVALPLVGGLILLGLSCFGCFVFTRRRRRRMAELGRMSRVTGSWGQDGQMNGSGNYDNIDMYKAGDAHMSGANGGQQMHEMSPMTPVQVQHARYSPHHQNITEEDGEGTPLNDAGPGDNQVQDHNLHDQFFGHDPHEDEVGQAVPLSPVHGGFEQQQQGHYPSIAHQEQQPQQQVYYPPPGQHQHDQIAPVVGSPRSQAGGSYRERVQQQQEGPEQGRDERGEWI